MTALRPLTDAETRLLAVAVRAGGLYRATLSTALRELIKRELVVVYSGRVFELTPKGKTTFEKIQAAKAVARKALGASS